MANVAGGRSIADYMRAAAAVQSAVNGREVLETVRPRGVTGVFRERLPLTWLLYLADMEGRLVWQGVHGFAMLEPPADGRYERRPQGVRHTVLHLLDRHWGAAQFATPPAAGLLTALALALIGPLVMYALFIVLLVALYTTVMLAAMLVRQIFTRGSHDTEHFALDSVSARHWSMTLFHQTNEHRIDELFNQVGGRLHELIKMAGARHVQVDQTRPADVLICLYLGITTPQALARIQLLSRAPYAERWHEAFSLQLFGARPGYVVPREAKPLVFVRFYVLAVVISMLMLAYLLMSTERIECAPSKCDSALTTYGRALAWILYQLVWSDLPGLEQASEFAVALVPLLRLTLPVLVLVVVVGYRRRSNAREEVRRQSEKRRMRIVGSTRVLIITITDVERDAMLTVLEEFLRVPVEPRYDRSVPVFAVGAINDTELFVIQAGSQGITSPASTPVVTADAIRHLAPDYALFVGVCYGLRPNEQTLGEVLVSQRVYDPGHTRFVESDALEADQHRVGSIVVSPRLFTALQAVAQDWQRQTGMSISFGQMLAWTEVLDAEPVIEQLRQRYPDAIGGDMEGATFHAAARFAGVEAIVVKAIAEWGGARKTGADQEAAAARNAAKFVLHLVETGTLAHIAVS